MKFPLVYFYLPLPCSTSALIRVWRLLNRHRCRETGNSINPQSNNLVAFFRDEWFQSLGALSSHTKFVRFVINGSNPIALPLVSLLHLNFAQTLSVFKRCFWQIMHKAMHINHGMESKRDKEAYYFVNIVLQRIFVAEISFVRNAIFH